MRRHSIALHWQVALAGSALAALLVFAVLMLSERLLVSHFEAQAEAQADDVARTLAASFLRALERRATELHMLSRAVDLVDLDKPDAARAELHRLADADPIYRTIKVARLNGNVVAATDAPHLPASVGDGPLTTLAVNGPWLTDSRKLPGQPAALPEFGIDVGVPLLDSAGRTRALLLAELDPNWFRRLRDEVLAHAYNATVLSVAVFSNDRRPLINDQPELNSMALKAASKTEDWLQFGMAYREGAREGAANKANALMRAEYRTEDVTDPAAGDNGRRVALVSGHVSHQLNAQTQVSARVAAKWAHDRSLGLDSRETTQLISARATYDIAPRWDLGAQAAALIGVSGRARQLGLGAEAGHLLADNLWVSVGWNLFGFTDRDLTAQDTTQRGFYIRLRFKFDEAMF